MTGFLKRRQRFGHIDTKKSTQKTGGSNVFARKGVLVQELRHPKSWS